MPINFPSSASLNNTYTYEGKTWKYNAQGAWEISSSTETGNEQGNTGELAYYTGNNSIIQGATAFFYDDTNLRVGVGTIIPDHTLDVTGPFGTLNVKGGATVGGDLTVGGDIIMTDAETIKIGGDTEHIAFNGAGAEINVRANELSIDHYLQHFGDSNTHLEFQTDNITLAAGGVDAIDIVPSHINLEVGISTSNGATFGNNVIIQNAGDVALTVKGDTDNSGENDNPLIRLEQDGSVVSCNIGINGESNNQFTGAQPNAFYIESVSDSTDNQYIQFATNNNDRMTILGDGNVGINNNDPKHLLHLEGGGISADGATFDQLTLSGNLILTDDAFIGVASNDERIIFDSDGNDITMRSNNVMIDRKLVHTSDTDTYIEFPNATDEVDMYAGGNHFLAADSGLLHIPTGISASQGATFANTVTIHSKGDVTLNLIADTDNSGENDNPLISMGQDNDQDNFTVGIVGNSGQIFTNSLANAGYLNTKHAHNDLQFAVDGDMKMTILDDGQIGIGTKTPGSTMDIIGGLNVSKGATFGSTVSMKDYSETVNAIGSVNSNTAVSFQDGTVQTVTVAGNCEFSFSNPPASGKAGTVTLIVTNGGAHTTTFASAVKWPSDVAPSLTTSGVDVISFLTTDGGSNIYGFVGGLNFS